MRALLQWVLGTWLSASAAFGENVRVTLRVIEVPHAQLTDWITGEKLSGAELHELAFERAANGVGKVLDTSVVTVRSGGRATIESIAEVVYPTEYDPGDGLDGSILQPPLGLSLLTPLPWTRPPYGSAFETRNTGVTFEILPDVARRGGIIDLEAATDFIAWSDTVVWKEYRDRWGDASIRFPLFQTQRLSSAVTLMDGRFELWSVFTPKPTKVPGTITRQLVFVRAEVLGSP